MYIRKNVYVWACFFLLACGSRNGVPSSPGQAEETVYIKGGRFLMGNTEETDATPQIEQDIPGFYIHRYEVNVASFREFTRKTGYRTLAEKNGGSYVFDPQGSPDTLPLASAPWWKYRKGADWQYPSGPGKAAAKDMEPVRHIAWEDACAYCAWLGMRLPSEAEREYLAQSGICAQDPVNTWQGVFPYKNEGTDGFASVAPVGSFPADRNGLYDISGNVWEWCVDPYHAGWYTFAAELGTEARRKGPARGYDPEDPYGETRVIRGGSFLCSDNYCSGYEPRTRMRSPVRLSFEHTGFRCAR